MKQAILAGYLVCGYDRIYRNYGMIYEDGVILEILPNEEIRTQSAAEGFPLWEEEDSVVMPGFVNAHMHQYGIVSHGIPVNVSFSDFEGFLKVYWWPYVEDRLSTKEVIPTTKASALELLHSGVTAFCDTLEAPFTEPDTLCRQADEIERMGMRAIVSLESSERVNWENGMACLQQNVDAVRYTRENCKLVRGAICTHTTFTCSPEFIGEAHKMAQEEGAILQFHLSESVYEPSVVEDPTFVYRDLGALGEHTLASQCVQISDAEIEALAASNTKAVHMPLSNCEVGGGFSPVSKMLDRGVCVGLGTDGYINDFFTVMKAAFLIHKANEQSTTVMPAARVFRMATENGARCLGYDRAGRLEKGYVADFSVMKDAFPSPLTEENILDQIVVHGKSEYVTAVVIDGKAVLKDGKCTTCDEQATLAEVRDAVADFWAAMK